MLAATQLPQWHTAGKPLASVCAVLQCVFVSVPFKLAIRDCLYVCVGVGAGRVYVSNTHARRRVYLRFAVGVGKPQVVSKPYILNLRPAHQPCCLWFTADPTRCGGTHLSFKTGAAIGVNLPDNGLKSLLSQRQHRPCCKHDIGLHSHKTHTS